MNRSGIISRLIILSFLSFALLMLTSCSQLSGSGKTSVEVMVDLVQWISDNNEGCQISFVEGDEVDYKSDYEKVRTIHLTYDRGDIRHIQDFELTYQYVLNFDWTLSSVSAKGLEIVEIANEIDIKRIISDLEGETYLSQYSDHIFESRRILNSELITSDKNAEVGYDRLVAEFELDADNVHEILSVDVEYLVDDKGCWYMLSNNITLVNVTVQSGVSDEIIDDAVRSLKIYREEEGTTWWLGNLERRNYEILDRVLDTDTSAEVITLSFRGEGEFMYISGEAKLEFHFSSGWYLYTSDIDNSVCETGMLSDDYLVGREQIISSIINDNKFNYGNVSYVVTEDMIKELTITNVKIADFGKYQTAYFSYILQYENATFNVDGYGKYELSTENGFILDTWNDIPEISYDLTGTWYGVDYADNYLVYYKLEIEDSKMGYFEGKLTVYGADDNDNAHYFINAKANIVGNITNGVNYSINLDKWIICSHYSEIYLPMGEYDFTDNTLVNYAGYEHTFKLSLKQPQNWLTQNQVGSLLYSHNLQSAVDLYK